jgi:hypothetical protein
MFVQQITNTKHFRYVCPSVCLSMLISFFLSASKSLKKSNDLYLTHYKHKAKNKNWNPIILTKRQTDKQTDINKKLIRR